MTSGIYQIRNTVNQHRYIGSTANINHRWTLHRESLNQNKHENRHLQNAWNKYGSGSFVFEFLESCGKDELLIVEQRFLDSVRPEYNILLRAGSPAGVKRTPETRRRMSEGQKGKKLLDETKQKLRLAHLGKVLSDSTKEKLRAFFKGRPGKKGKKLTDEQKEKLRLANLGRTPSAATREKLRLGRIGKKHSDETKNKLRISSTGNKNSLGRIVGSESKNKIKQSVKEWWNAHVSGFRGVRKSRDKFRATIYVNKNQINLGCFSTPEEAARAYDEAAKKYLGKHAYLNFP